MKRAGKITKCASAFLRGSGRLVNLRLESGSLGLVLLSTATLSNNEIPMAIVEL